jgi:hypothetical protein
MPVVAKHWRVEKMSDETQKGFDFNKFFIKINTYIKTLIEECSSIGKL